MKFISVLLAVALTAHAAPSDPGRAAIDFLEKVRAGTVNLEPGGDTALSPQTAERKRREIAKRLERLSRDLGGDALEVGAVKTDENFAAVLVRKVGGFDSSRLQVFPVALVKRDSEWEAAPVPASFENVGAGYAIALRKRVEQLEDWMLREQVLDLQKLRNQANQRMRTRIEANLSAGQLKEYNVEEAANRFLTACRTGDIPAALGLAGGLSDPLPKDWPIRLKAVEKALEAGKSVPRPWRLLVSPDVARVVTHHDEDGNEGSVSVACLDPAGIDDAPPEIEELQFKLTRTDGLWRIDLPSALLHDSAGNSDEDAPEDQANPKSGSAGGFSKAWLADHPPAPQPTAELATRAWLAALHEGHFQSFLAISKIDGDPDVAAKACIRAAQVWWSIRAPGGADLAVPLSFKEEGSGAACIYQFFTARDPDKLDARALYFEKSTAGWLWNPATSRASRGKFNEWVLTESGRLSDTWQQQLLSGCPVIGNIDGLEAPTEAEARLCVESWLADVMRGDFSAALTRIACLGRPASRVTALRNLGYEITAMRGREKLPPVFGIHLGTPWAAVGVKIERDGTKPVFPLYTVVKTPDGPKLLMEIDLFASSNRNRDFLNKTALDHLGEATSPAAESGLNALLKEHQSAVDHGQENAGP